VEYRIEIKGQRFDIGELTGVYSKLEWNLFADNSAGRVEQTGGEVTLPAPDPETFIPLEEVTDAQKLEWLEAQHPEGWLAAQKAALSQRFDIPIVTVDELPSIIAI